MSWEEDFKSVRPCPCGKGEIVSIFSSNDWGQSNTELEIRCQACHEAGYIVVEDHDCKETWKRVIHRDEWNAILERRKQASIEAEKGRKEAERQRLAADEEVRARFSSSFVAMFSHIKTKKGLWEVLKPIRLYLDIQTISGFDTLVREVGREEALRRVPIVANQQYIEALIAGGMAPSADLIERFEKVRVAGRGRARTSSTKAEGSNARVGP